MEEHHGHQWPPQLPSKHPVVQLKLVTEAEISRQPKPDLRPTNQHKIRAFPLSIDIEYFTISHYGSFLPTQSQLRRCFVKVLALPHFVVLSIMVSVQCSLFFPTQILGSGSPTILGAFNADGRRSGWMREDTCHFEVEVLRIYGCQELWSHGFGARPVSDGPYQPVDAADVRRRVAFGARQDNEFAVRAGTAACIGHAGPL
ncbi:hypothetical protein THAOC_21022 [Thalassiosira oceanica]|uniref:DUF6743 domain-containing protein n=1 Tax=Thalassiosira oceanica TaxID=159749 RepID=K0S1Z6_THAOC|nr:hypothetical protein THAOC_21022 [Thalassiosira oceanica]|eukprot:EJK58819.1 hypothetical protein THAOC_21022 [Thalassiosira oceanica]